MKKILICLTALVLVFSVGCAKKEESGLAFKKDYESVNGKENSHGKLHRELDIPEDKLLKDYENYCKYGPSFSKVEFYRFNAIWEEYVEGKGEQIEVGFMGTGLGYLISVQTSDFRYEITDSSNW